MHGRLFRVLMWLYPPRFRARFERELTEFFEGVRRDLRFGVRSLMKRPAFTAVAVGVLALGIGASTTLFSAVNGVLLRPRSSWSRSARWRATSPPGGLPGLSRRRS